MSPSSLRLLPMLVSVVLIAPAAHADKLLIKDDYTYPVATTVMNESEVKAKMKPCLNCHASKLLPGDGEKIIGLGDNFFDGIQPGAGGNFDTVFGNPAITLTALIFKQIVPATLEEKKPHDLAIEAGTAGLVAPPRVPPWWRVKHKHASFYIASARGNRISHKMLFDTSDLAYMVLELVETPMERSAAISKVFKDAQEPSIHITNWITNMPIPVYENYGGHAAFSVDDIKAGLGKTVFDTNCKSCHAPEGGGTYLVTKDHAGLGTDAGLCTTPGNRKVDADWFNASPFNTVLGGIATPPSETTLGKCAYVAPPLHGIWAAAPYLHNGSVPTLLALLKGSERTAKWIYLTDTHDGKPSKRQYDNAAVGWKVEAPITGGSATPAMYIYDTTKPGYGNAGHTYGDALGDTDRFNLIEYLKTL